ncbi:hypothetical protein WJX75_001872 [Coccomyxa subellipsoidea]|uniref:Right handed beta helix domain-containing protein n=1 Tax=Coccomyxa subellipsoidea TaxID=248742 RepID=A0ABR2YT32_9CHLO
MQVCKRWFTLGRDPCFTTVVQGQQLNIAVSLAGPGDTISIRPGFYQEIVLVEKPLKFVGENGQDIQGRSRRGVVIQSNRSMCILSNARACFQNIVFRAIMPSTDRSIISYGPACSYIRLEECELGGITGLLIPDSKGPDTRLVLKSCYLHGVPHSAAVFAEAGKVRMEGCTVTNCQMAMNACQGVEVDIRNNDLSFNEVALVVDGHGLIQDNIMWGNLHRSTIDVSPEALERLEAQMAADAADGQLAASAASMGPQEGADEAGAGPAAAGQPADGGEPASPGGSRRTRGAQPRQPPIRFSGNHIMKPLRLRHQDADQQRIRKRAKKLAAEVYGEHEQGGDWDDDGEWHLVNDGDLDSSDEDDNASVHSSDLSDHMLGDPEDYSSFSDDSDDESLHSSEFDTSDDDLDSSDSSDGDYVTDSEDEGGEEQEQAVLDGNAQH